MVGSIADYPDPEAKELTQSLAQHLSLSEQQIIITNGSAEAFYLIAHSLSRRSGGVCRTAITVPSFAEYEDRCRIYGHEIDYITFDELRQGDQLSGYDSLWLGLPNNPDGERVEYCDIVALAERYPTCCFVVDRAYNSLSKEVEREWRLLDNIIIVDSFTKSYGIPGLRLGYLIAAEEVISRLGAIRLPWSVNSLSQLAGLYILDNYETLQPDREELVGESKYLQAEISKIDGFRVIPSDCNFFLIEITSHGESHELQRYLVDNHHILVRDCSNFRTLSSKYIRIAAQRREACDKLITALKLWR